MRVLSQCEVFCSQVVAAVSKDINRSFQSYFAAKSSLFSWPCFDGCCSQFHPFPQDFKIDRFLHLKRYFEASLVQLISRDSSPWTWVTLEWNCQKSSPRLSAMFAASTSLQGSPNLVSRARVHLRSAGSLVLTKRNAASGNEIKDWGSPTLVPRATRLLLNYVSCSSANGQKFILFAWLIQTVCARTLKLFGFYA